MRFFWLKDTLLQSLSLKVARSSLRRPISTIFGPWAQKWPEACSEGLFRAFSALGPRSGQEQPQKAYFEHCQPWGPEAVKIGLTLLNTVSCTAGYDQDVLFVTPGVEG